MVKLALLSGLLMLIAILAAVPRRHNAETGRESQEGQSLGLPQHVYLHLHNDDELIAKP